MHRIVYGSYMHILLLYPPVSSLATFFNFHIGGSRTQDPLWLAHVSNAIRPFDNYQICEQN